MNVREVVMDLEGRQRELVAEAAQGVQTAKVRLQQCIAQGVQAEQHFKTLLEAVTDEDPQGLLYDVDSGQVFREAAE